MRSWSNQGRLMKRFITTGAALAALSYFFDPINGKRRRDSIRNRSAAWFRSTGRQTDRLSQNARSRAAGLSQKATHLRPAAKEQPDDVTLAHKVETEIFRGDNVPKGDINVNAEGGVVFLRGEVADETLIDTLGSAARKVQGVLEVENLLHTPGTPAPTKQS